jgi:hypothetical protein
MTALGRQLAELGPIPVVLHYDDGAEEGPVQLERVNVERKEVRAAVPATLNGTDSYARIVGGLDDDELAMEFPTETAEFDDLEDLLADENVFEQLRTVTGVEKGI